MSLVTRNILVPLLAFAAFFAVTLLFWWAYLFAAFSLLFAVMALLYLRVSRTSAAASLLGMGCAASVWMEPAFLPPMYALLFFAPGVVCASETLKRGLRLSECVFLTAAAIMGGSVAALGLMYLAGGGVEGAVGGILDAFMRMYGFMTPSSEESLLAVFNLTMETWGMEPLPDMAAYKSLMADALRMSLPQTVLTFSAAGGVIAVTVPRAVLLRGGRDEGFARFMPIRLWVVPGNVLFGTAMLYGIFLLVYLLTGSAPSRMLYDAAVGLLVAVYGLMGAGTLDRWMYRLNVPPGARMLILLVLYLFLRVPLCVIALLDTVARIIIKRDMKRKEEDKR